MSDTLTMHHQPELHLDLSIPDPRQDSYSKAMLGFWIYLMTDCLIFATLFATYAVLHDSTFGGPGSKEIFDLNIVFPETVALLLSSLTCGFALLSAKRSHKNQTLLWLFASFFLGATFLFIEVNEFAHLAAEGNDWTRSAFLSSYFTLVGTHGLHVTAGSLWLLVMITQLFFQGIVVDTFRRLVLFSMFWHFLDLVWIFVFTFVYLLGVI